MSTARSNSRVRRMLAWAGLLAIGCGSWLYFANGGESGRAWRALLIDFIYFTSLAGGLVTWPAIVRGCNGRWHAGLERSALAGITFAVPSVLVLVLLWVGSPSWSPWYQVVHHQGVWMENGFVLGRDLVCLVLFWAFALFYLVKRRSGNARTCGNFLILVYCLVFSLLGFDLVMGLDPKWYSTMAGGYFFISGLYIAITGWAFLASWQESAADQRHDLGKLMVGFSLMTTYLMYAQLLPIWYENLPEEVRFLIPRLGPTGWKLISYGLVAVVYLGPLVLLLTERAKRNRWLLGGISLLVLFGLWIERWWLVTPTLQPSLVFGLPEILTAFAFVGVLGLGMELFHRQVPSKYLSEEGP